MNNYKIETGSLYRLENNKWLHITNIPASIKTIEDAIEWHSSDYDFNDKDWYLNDY